MKSNMEQNKMNTMKKLVVAGWLVAAGLCGTGWAVPAPETDFTFDSATGTITKYKGAGGDVEIPSTIGDVTVKTIGECAFIRDDSLKSVTIPASVTNILDGAFCGTFITNFTFAAGSQLKTIGASAFNLTDMRELTIPASVKEIGTSAFARNEALRVLTFEEGSQLEVIGDGAFNDSYMENAVVIPASVKHIGDQAFAACLCAAAFIFAEGSQLETIGDQAFLALCSVKDFSIPASVTNVGNKAFSSCDQMTNLTVLATTPPTAGEDLFAYCLPELKIHVPEGTAAAYKAAPGWSAYANLITDGTEPVAGVQKLNFVLQAFGATQFGTVTMADGETLGEDETWVWACLGSADGEAAKSAWAALNAMVGKPIGTANLQQVTNGLDAASFGASDASPFDINVNINQKTVALVRAAKADGTIRAIGGVRNTGKLEADRTHENEMLGEGPVSVAYYAWNGEAKKLVLQPEVQAIQVTDETTVLEDDKWYLVSGDWTFNQNIAVSGSAHLILWPRANVNLPGLDIAADAALSVYTMWDPDKQYVDLEIGVLNCSGAQVGARACFNMHGCAARWDKMHLDTINFYGGFLYANELDGAPAICVGTALNVYGGEVHVDGYNSASPGIVGGSAGAAVNVYGGMLQAGGGLDSPGIDVGSGASQVSLTLGEGVHVWVADGASGMKTEATNYAESRERLVWVTDCDLIRVQDFTVARNESTFRVKTPNEPGEGYCWAVITLRIPYSTGAAEQLMAQCNQMLQSRSLLNGIGTPFAAVTAKLDAKSLPYSVEYHTGDTFDLNNANADMMLVCRVTDTDWHYVYTMGGATNLQALAVGGSKENEVDDGEEPEPDPVEATYYAWNGEEVTGPFTTNAIPVTADMTTLNSGWYVVNSVVSNFTGLVVKGDAHLILADGAELYANGGDYAGICVNVVEGGATNSISIYGQENNTGKLIAIGGEEGAGIGAQCTEEYLNTDYVLPIDCGVIAIHGGDISAISANGSGIGSFDRGENHCGNYGGTITIYGGRVNATGGANGAGIGSCGCTPEPIYGDAPSCRVTVYDGEITAGLVEELCVSGIGGGMGRNGGIVTIYGGTVQVVGVMGAGIGGGDGGDGGDITIYGGNIQAQSLMGAGIGGGLAGAGGTVTINGGTVNAVGLPTVGGDEEDPVIYAAGAGIGGGLAGAGGTVAVNGGEVTAISYPVDMGEGFGVVQSDGIGAGYNLMDPDTSLDPGTLNLNGYEAVHYIYAGMDTNGVEVTEVAAGDFASVWHTNLYVQITATKRQGPPEGSPENPWDVAAPESEVPVTAYTNGTGAVIVKGEGTPKSFGENEEPWADAQPPITRIIVPTGRGPEFREKWPAMADLIEELQNYLAFTGVGEWGGSVSLNGTGNSEDPLLETAFDVFGPWTPLAISEDKMSDMIELTPGKTVYFRRRDPIPVMNFSTTEYCWQFMIEGTVAASGNIMSLLDKTCQQTAVGERAFASLFSGRAEGLMSAPELPATDLAVECYSGMFSGCTSLTNAPALPATTLARSCYSSMFSGCTALTDAPELPATTLAVWCCSSMFSGCTSLTNVSRLAAREFCDCSAMAMFAFAEKLNALTVEFDSWPTAKDATAGWLSEVAETGVFTCPIGLPVIKDANHIPEGWVVKKRFTLPVTMETGRYVVSNLTGEATLVEPIRTSGNDAIYEVTSDMSIGIYLEPAPGYVALGRNPLLLSDLSAGVDLYGMLPWTTLTPDGAGYRPWQWTETAYGYPRIDLLNDNGSHPWPLLDENCCPMGWAAYTNANGDVVFIGEGPLPEGFAEEPPFDDILQNAPKIIVPTGEADRFRTALPDFADKVTTLPQEDPLKALCIGIGSNAGCLSQNTAKSPDMASVLTTCHAEIVEAMRARPAVAPYLALAGNTVLDALGAFYGEPEEVSAETEALLGIFAETVAAVDLLTAAPSGICVTAAAMLDKYDYRSEEMAQFKRELFSNFVAALPNRPLREVDALGQVGEAMMSSIRYIGNPEQFPLVTAAFTDAAEGLSGCLEAQALGTVAAQLMKSVARQPEAAGTLREAFADVVKLSRSVVGRTDVRAQALSTVATQLMDAIARQPEAAGTLREAFFDVVKSFAGRTGVQSLALGRIGGSLMDAMARQPEARSQLRGAFADVAEKVAGLSDVQACALSMVGGSLMDAMARQPEASNAILAACLDAADAIRGKTDAQAEMLGKIGGSLMDAMARQPEARSQLRGAFADAMAMAGGLPDGEALALGKTGGGLMDATARQPEVAGTLHAAFLDIAAAVDGRTESQALAIGRVGGNQMDAMARQPEVSFAIRDAVTNLVVKAIEQRSDAKALALGETGASLMDAIARQPDEYETLCSAFGTVVVAVDSCMSDVQAQALGRTGGGLMDAIARQPEETQNILKGFAVVKELTVVSPDAQAQMLGEIGEQLMASIARQPTAADEMVEFFLLVGKEMQGGSEEWVSAIGNAAVIGVDTLARSPASFETLVKMFDVGEDTMRACTPRATPGIGLSLVGLASAMASYWQNPNIADELLVQQMNFDLLIRDVCWMVRIVSAESARTEGAWSGAAQVVYELRWLETDKPYALTFDLKAAGQTGSCTTNLPKAVVDGVYTQEIYRTEFFGPESQVQDPAAELTLKLIEKSKYGK